MNSVVLLGNYAPRCCGIATFTQDLRNALCPVQGAAGIPVAMVSDRPAGHYRCPPEVRYQFEQHDRASYRRTAREIDRSGAELLCVQHEYGIFGGPDGEWILDLLGDCRQRVVTTCHTVLQNPGDRQRRIVGALADRSDRLIVMTNKARELLIADHGVDPGKIAVIAHGIPDLSADPDRIAAMRAQNGWVGRRILLTFGLLSPNKGIESIVRALPAIAARHPEILYVVVGATHPNLLRREGESYRESLAALAQELGVARHLAFVNRFVDVDELVQMILAADLYATPYLQEAQVTSGTLAYAFGLGKPVISTPYWHAAELLADGRGCLVPFRDSDAVAESAVRLLDDDALRLRMSSRAREAGRLTVWPEIGRLHRELFREVLASRPATARPLTTSSAVPAAEIVSRPPVAAGISVPRLDHLRRLWGPLGLYQHARFTEPDLAHGYCSDDNARAAIMLADYADAGGATAESVNLLRQAFGFLLDAWNPAAGKFRNFRDADGQWLEEAGSEDSQGRVFWALGHLAASSPLPATVRDTARSMLRRDLRTPLDFRSPRAWSFALLGIDACLRVRPHDAAARRTQDDLCRRLLHAWRANRGDGWEWIENSVTYDNARICQAAIVTGARLGKRAFLDAGLAMLDWLIGVQWTPAGHFRPIGCHGFLKRGDPAPAPWDQQPLEAGSTVAACLAAWRATRDADWLLRAEAVYAWFLGANLPGVVPAVPETGGCHDGIHSDGLNLNQGAESTLSYLQATLDLRRARRDATRDYPLALPARATATADRAVTDAA